ncbi:MAG: acetyltransferase [Ectothiorhodospiraceae bacterium]|nr:acetyltransferase [Ectothiorhodospiraceae bacterium]
MTNPLKEQLILLGGGGHAAVLAEIFSTLNIPLLGFTDVDTANAQQKLPALNFLGDDNSLFNTYQPEDIILINGLGSTGSTMRREDIFKLFIAKNYAFLDVFHPTAIISLSVQTHQGLQVLADAIVNTGVIIGTNVLINSRAVVEHHCNIGDHCHIASGAVVCGDCNIGQSVHVGAGAVVNQGITIGDGAIIASGAVVIADVAAGSVMAGVPAKRKS